MNIKESQSFSQKSLFLPTTLRDDWVSTDKNSMKLKFTEYNQKFITSMEEAGFLLVGATIGLLESRANFLLEVEGDRKAMGITFSGTEQEIKQKGWTNPNLPKLGKSSKL